MDLASDGSRTPSLDRQNPEIRARTAIRGSVYVRRNGDADRPA
jgi:hypothetical protein